ncbi:MAG: hypothetical protein ACR2RE_11405 [Geminicoccaceae bacterium]
MSRHTLTSKNPKAAGAVAGWDGPLNTFFFQQLVTIIVDGEEYDDTSIWIGTDPGEHTDVDAFLGLITEHAELPDGFREQLVEDRDAMPFDADRPAYNHGLVTRPA